MIDPALQDCRQRIICGADGIWEPDTVWDGVGEWGGRRADFDVKYYENWFQKLFDNKNVFYKIYPVRIVNKFNTWGRHSVSY